MFVKRTGVSVIFSFHKHAHILKKIRHRFTSNELCMKSGDSSHTFDSACGSMRGTFCAKGKLHVTTKGNVYVEYVEHSARGSCFESIYIRWTIVIHDWHGLVPLVHVELSLAFFMPIRMWIMKWIAKEAAWNRLIAVSACDNSYLQSGIIHAAK